MPTIIIGFFAALIGTIIMTLVQEVEILITKRERSYVPAKVFRAISGFDFENDKNAWRFVNWAFHFFYGTSLGFILVLLYSSLRIQNYFFLALTFFLVVWMIALFASPVLTREKGSKIEWPWRWRFGNLLKDGFFHLVYSFSTIYFFFLISKIN